MNNYIDITNKWLGNKPNQINKVKMYNLGDTFLFRGKKYKLDNHYVKYNMNNNELTFIKWLSKKIQKKIVLIPKINYPLGIQTPDYRIGNEYWDLKTISKNNTSKQPVYHLIIKKKYQCNNFIIDASFSKHSLATLLDELNILIIRNKIPWINKIAIKKHNMIVILKIKR